MIHIINPGIFTTVQDLGRFGYQEFGMPVSGAMDWYSFKLANTILNNDINAACLEATYNGPEFEVLKKTRMIITGGYPKLLINSLQEDPLKVHHLKKGDIVSIGTITKGCRIYISFTGGIDVPLVMNSRSTYLRAKLGGYKGRILKQDDILTFNKSRHKPVRKTIPESKILQYSNHQIIRVVGSTDIDHFTLEGVKTFLTSEYLISSQSDRMGYRLDGPPIEHEQNADIISSGMCNGAIQIPGSGSPIIMLADRQTVGGYSKIGNIITADLPLLAQLKPGDNIKFKQVKLVEAHNILQERETELKFS